MVSECTGAVMDFECTICSDVLLEPVVAPCGHDMCQECYRKWQAASLSGAHLACCPLCRAHLPPNLAVCQRLKQTVEALYPVAVKRRRDEQQEALEALAACKRRATASGQCTADCTTVHRVPSAVADAHTMPMLGPTAWPWMQGMAASYQVWALHQQMGWTAVVGNGHITLGYPLAPSPLGIQAQRPTATPSGQDTADRHVQRSAQSLVGQEMQGPPVAGPQTATSSDEQGVCHTGQPAIQPPATASASDASSGSLVAREADNAGGAADAVSNLRWQSLADVPLRLACARQIMELLRARCGPRTNTNTAATLAAVRAVEVHLYRTAPSCQQYMDRSTLPVRVAAYVRQRAAAIAAARSASGVPAPPRAPTVQPERLSREQEVEQPCRAVHAS